MQVGRRRVLGYEVVHGRHHGEWVVVREVVRRLEVVVGRALVGGKLIVSLRSAYAHR